MKYLTEIDPTTSPLTKRENEFLGLLGQGLSRAEMSKLLNRSIKTVDTHLMHIFQKLDADNEKQALMIAVLKGILSPKNLLVCGLMVSGVFNLILPGPAYATDWDDDDHHTPSERVFRVRARFKSRRGNGGRRNERDGLEWFWDE
jgi:DNA-binding CsgD family transcriptional regulator